MSADLARLKIPRTYLSILEKKHEIERVGRGVYKKPGVVEDEMSILQSAYQACVYSHETALYLHDLTDRTPLRYSLSAPSGYHSKALKATGYKIYYVSRKLFSLGISLMPSPQGNKIYVTDLERTICDIVRSRNQMDIEFVITALKRYAARKDKNTRQLYEYAKSFYIEKNVRHYMEILL